MLSESKVSKGYLTVVPKVVREDVDIQEGDLLSWEVRKGEVVVRRRRPKSLKDMIGVIAHGGDAVADKRRLQRGPHGVR
ncbi:MAG TPA: AbrB/MazE/SpoVT family DNA-binding domain-containing protein [Thermoplasmata archaeon]